MHACGEHLHDALSHTCIVLSGLLGELSSIGLAEVLTLVHLELVEADLAILIDDIDHFA